MVGLRSCAAAVPQGQLKIASVTRACFSAGFSAPGYISPAGTTESGILQNSWHSRLTPVLSVCRADLVRRNQIKAAAPDEGGCPPVAKLKIRPRISLSTQAWPRLPKASQGQPSPPPPPGVFFLAGIRNTEMNTKLPSRSVKPRQALSRGFGEKRLFIFLEGGGRKAGTARSENVALPSGKKLNRLNRN